MSADTKALADARDFSRKSPPPLACCSRAGAILKLSSSDPSWKGKWSSSSSLSASALFPAPRSLPLLSSSSSSTSGSCQRRCCFPSSKKIGGDDLRSSCSPPAGDLSPWWGVSWGRSTPWRYLRSPDMMKGIPPCHSSCSASSSASSRASFSEAFLSLPLPSLVGCELKCCWSEASCCCCCCTSSCSRFCSFTSSSLSSRIAPPAACSPSPPPLLPD
mmetsp:Transcript_10158/g.33904  ORF Transcript_10158/g.33904 Transcript_10158/m.33904 type:complete len:217 (+) Transcript_10158:474-1124(+)